MLVSEFSFYLCVVNNILASKNIKDMNALIGLILFVAAALAGWGIAALKYKALPYKKSDGEIKAEEAAEEKLKKDGFNEMTISDVIRTISAKGYQAI